MCPVADATLIDCLYAHATFGLALVSTGTTRLYRPVGHAELALIAQSGFREFPPRLSHQPIFYPVLSRAYAEQIAQNWNTRDEASGFVGFVTEFDVSSEYLSQFQPQTVGSRAHQEYWIPAEELDAFNRHLIGEIRVIGEYRSDSADPKDGSA